MGAGGQCHYCGKTSDRCECPDPVGDLMKARAEIKALRKRVAKLEDALRQCEADWSEEDLANPAACVAALNQVSREYASRAARAEDRCRELEVERDTAKAIFQNIHAMEKAEIKALRVRVAKLEDALRRLLEECRDQEADLPYYVLRDADAALSGGNNSTTCDSTREM